MGIDNLTQEEFTAEANKKKILICNLLVDYKVPRAVGLLALGAVVCDYLEPLSEEIIDGFFSSMKQSILEIQEATKEQNDV